MTGRDFGRGRGRPRTSILENSRTRTSRTRTGTGTRTSEDEDGEDVDVLRRPAIHKYEPHGESSVQHDQVFLINYRFTDSNINISIKTFLQSTSKLRSRFVRFALHFGPTDS